MKPLLITTLLAVLAPVASANDIVDFFKARRKVHQTIFKAHRDVHRTVHRKVFHPGRRIHTRRIWVPVRYEIVRRRVHIHGTTRTVWSPARYEIRYDHHGYSHRVLVSRGHWHTIRTNDHYEWRSERVRRGGYYRTVDAGHRHGDRGRDRHRRHRG